VDLTAGPDTENAGSIDDTLTSTSVLQPDDHWEPSSGHDISGEIQDVPMSATETAANITEAPVDNPPHTDSSLTHQIGLVSLPSGDNPRYIGPSSGHFFTQLVCTASALTKTTIPNRLNRSNTTLQRDNALTEKLPRDLQTPLPSSKDLAQELTQTYFQTIHQTLPFLHEPTHMRMMDEMYSSSEPDHVVAFQVYIVLAISSICYRAGIESFYLAKVGPRWQ
jgi:hypothetical protein